MDRHPVQERPDLPPDRRSQMLEQHLARLWDQVWWLSLPTWRRWYYRLRGFRAPIPVGPLRGSGFYDEEPG